MASASTPALAVEVFFSAESKTVLVGGVGKDTTFDVFLNIGDTAVDPEVDVSLFLSTITLTPQPGAVGSVFFNPPPLNEDADNNIEPATTNPFAFDILFGSVFEEKMNLLGSFTHVDPAAAPHGAGIAAIPIHVAPGTNGDFLVEFGTDPEIDGFFDENYVVYPGFNTPVSGTLTVVNVPEPSSAGRMYWVDANNKQLKRARLDGTEQKLILETDFGITHAVVDEIGQKI